MDLPKQHIQQIRQTVSVSEHEGRLHLTATTPGASNLSGVNRQHTFASNKPAKSETVGECANLQMLFPKIKQLYSTSAYSGLGTAVVSGDFSGSGRASVAISAPYFIPAIYDNRHSNGKLAAGAVFVLSDADPVYNFSQQDILDTYPQVIRPPVDSAMRFPLFGSSMAVVDFNADGVDDLAVGSSGFGEHPESSMLGRVDIYLGQQNVGLSSRPNFTLTAEQLARFTHSQKHRIGGHLFGEDVNQDGFVDLIIGAPYDSEQRNKRHSGNVYGYMARSYRQPGVLGAPDFTLNSPSPNAFEWFGQTARAVKLANSTLLLVGAPGHRETDATGQTHPLVGRIYAFNVGNSTIPLFGGLEFATTKDNTQLGSQMYVWDSSTGGNPLVLFGSPSEHNSVLGQAVYVPDKPVPERGWQAGEVRVIDPTQWAYGSGSSNQKSLDEMSGLLDTLRGMQSPGHFGRALATTLESLWIGEPFSDMEDGRVYRWKRGTKLPTCYAIPGMRQARFGHSISVVDAGDKQIVLVTAPHDSQFSRFSGSISILSSDET
ncbi:hypothetical protein H4R22_004175 [Coemansia sp. RSA 1290]|nr:hypothetical protein H4R22_004175 [Coemansia sp. RSA 1290]